MSRKTRAAQKTTAIVSEEHGVLSNNADKVRDQDPTEISLTTIFKKLGSLDRIEGKLDNLHDRVQLVEERVSKIEDDSLDSVSHEEISSMKNTAQNLQRRLETRDPRNVKKQGNPYFKACKSTRDKRKCDQLQETAEFQTRSK